MPAVAQIKTAGMLFPDLLMLVHKLIATAGHR